MARKKESNRAFASRDIRRAKPTIIAEGKRTEYYYFKHLCELIGLSIERMNRNDFGRKAVGDFEEKIDEVLAGKGSVVVVFDTDVMDSDETQKKLLQKIMDKYKDNDDVLICDSYPCIEYWFLLHFGDTNGMFSSSFIVHALRGHNDNNTNRKKTNKKKKKEEEKKCMPDYCKEDDWLNNRKWVEDLRKDGKEQIACQNAYKYREGGALYEKGRSYTNIYKFFERYLPELFEKYLPKK